MNAIEKGLKEATAQAQRMQIYLQAYEGMHNPVEEIKTLRHHRASKAGGKPW